MYRYFKEIIFDCQSRCLAEEYNHPCYELESVNMENTLLIHSLIPSLTLLTNQYPRCGCQYDKTLSTVPMEDTSVKSRKLIFPKGTLF